MTARKKQLWQEIFDTHRHSEARSCLFDHALLCDFIRRLDGARPALVVHGGSSIARSDLECLSRTGVARVNFGTEIFRGYLLALADELPGQRLAAKDDHAVVMPYLECATSSWRDWLEQPPTWVFNYAEKLVANYIRPLADPISAGLGECHVHV
jgi:hypothetical protein